MAFFRLSLLFSLLALLGNVWAESSETSCNPLTNSSCPADPALGTEHTWLFNTTLDKKLWTMKTGKIDYTSTGAEFAIRSKKASTLLESNFYIFFGVMEVHAKMAKGAGIISSVILQSDDLDEIDWEWVGYNTSEVQSDFFGKGNTTTDNRGAMHAVSNADTEYHNYTSYWDKDRLEWWIDGDLRRTVNYSESLTLYGKNYPQTPCKVKVSNWPVGVDGQSKGNIEWGGGMVDWDDLPFIMSVSQLRVQDFHSGKEYQYQGTTGTYDSINVVSGNSTALNELNKPKAKSASEKWDDLGKGAHIGVYIGAVVAGLLAAGAIAFWCLRQRRQGRLQRALNDKSGQELQAMDTEYKSEWRQSQWGTLSYQKVQ
ncbi:uncharacterized protein N7459_002358 [Penicillium hispanicum]|uniref:uncharacterized protein n=1 Tax=Penicillium hispanicum TaxID=1080232 RepID=UPI0025409B67|nr:uncharacterized protein N7459_002358 [Penicillium hispanicum]KAJ5591989.1 hypothetical protein N7459_002358 [Penicillium hispanicum]